MRSEAGRWAQKQYRSRKWRTLRKQHLAKHPWCQCPHHEGQYIKADTVDHKIPHKGDPRKFWDLSNLQSMTKECHDRFKASQERGGRGFDQACDEKGMPLVPRKQSPWFTRWGQS